MRRYILEAGDTLTLSGLEDIGEALDKGGFTRDNLYMAVSYTQSAGLGITCRCDGTGKKSTWSLVLDWPEGEVLKGTFEAQSASAYDIYFAAADLTNDDKEDFVLFIVPKESKTKKDGELHVFSEQDGALQEILVIRSGLPESSSVVLPDDFHPILPDDDADAKGLDGLCESVEVMNTQGLGLLRLGAYGDQTTAYTYLWYNYDGQWEAVGQTVQSNREY